MMQRPAAVPDKPRRSAREGGQNSGGKTPARPTTSRKEPSGSAGASKPSRKKDKQRKKKNLAVPEISKTSAKTVVQRLNKNGSVKKPHRFKPGSK